MKKTISLSVGIALALFAVLFVSAASATTTVTIQDVSIAEGETITVPIMINDVVNAAIAHIVLSYNQSVVNVTDIGNSAFTESFRDINNSGGYVRYCGYNMAGLTGNLKFLDVTLEAVGSHGEQSPLNLTVVSLLNLSTNQIPRDVLNGTFTIQETTPPVVINPRAEPMIIPDDTDNEPLWGELAELMVNATDESGIANVTIDLTAIGGEQVSMSNIGNYSVGNTVWCVFNYTTNASIGTAGWNATSGTYEPYYLEVNATDIYGISNTSVSIELTVMKNGDVDENGEVKVPDVIYLVNHLATVPGYGDIIQEIADVDGNGEVKVPDVIYLVNHLATVPGYGELR